MRGHTIYSFERVVSVKQLMWLVWCIWCRTVTSYKVGHLSYSTRHEYKGDVLSGRSTCTFCTFLIPVSHDTKFCYQDIFPCFSNLVMPIKQKLWEYGLFHTMEHVSMPAEDTMDITTDNSSSLDDKQFIPGFQGHLRHIFDLLSFSYFSFCIS